MVFVTPNVIIICARPHGHMRYDIIPILVMSVTLSFLLPAVLAHSPLGTGDNESLATATPVPDPAKSWAIYGELHEGGEAQYFRFDMAEGQRVHVGLLTSTRPDDGGFIPSLVLMGPGLGVEDPAPDYVEVPEGAGIMVVEGRRPAQAMYEPFTPSSLYPLADIDLDAPDSGTYYVAVYESQRGGHYTVAIGDRESYSIVEYVLIPISLMSIYQWGGQSPALVYAPMALVLASGLGLLAWKWRDRGIVNTPSGWIGASAGLLFLGTCATVLLQMVLSLASAPLVPEVALTLLFALMPAALGVAVLRIGLRAKKIDARTRIYLAILGVLALFAWAGLLIGPALSLIASMLPARYLTNRENL